MTERTLVGDQNGAAMRALRKRSELTVREVCDLLAKNEGITVHAAHLRNVERNARGASDQLIGGVARVLNVPKVALYGRPASAEMGAGAR